MIRSLANRIFQPRCAVGGVDARARLPRDLREGRLPAEGPRPALPAGPREEGELVGWAEHKEYKNH